MAIAKLKDDGTLAAANDAGLPRSPAVVVKLRRPAAASPRQREALGHMDAGKRAAAPLDRAAAAPRVADRLLWAEIDAARAERVVWKEAGDLITQPFYWAGSQDIGLGWRVATSLQRVAVGFGLAAIVGVAIGAIIGQSIWAMPRPRSGVPGAAYCPATRWLRFRSRPSEMPTFGDSLSSSSRRSGRSSSTRRSASATSRRTTGTWRRC